MVLVPKVEPDMEPTTEKMIDEGAPSQSILEVVPIYPTQEVIDISSSSEDEHEPQPNPIKIVVPKIEEGLVTSPSARLITEVLMSMGQDKDEQPEPDSPPDPSIPSFSLNLEWSTPLVTEEQPPTTLEEEFPLTARTVQVIEGMDEQVSGDRPPAETPKPTQVMKDDLEERVAILATVPKGDNEFETIFKLRGHRILEALRYQFTSMAPTSYIDIQVVTLMCHILNADEDEQFEKLVYCVPPEILMFALDSKNISSPSSERMELNKFHSNILNQLLKWAGAPSILKKGSLSLLPTYINIPQQPNDFDCAIFVMKWMEMIDPTILAGCCTYNIEQWTEPMLLEFRKKIVVKIILSKENSLRAEAIKEAHNMRLTRPAAALRSPYVQVETPDLPTK
ncbi:hypothetical protein PIB30_068288 [Stylosanthes scabra]|uniref:Ubiquitin-like protease family profile domain-containing protein n=1 Tax=Stylosanthes scabra TaxID=79078 RepID=A0ABU6ULL6_9FABA|nr:hypothetical protein [Stylosanthes scabra]